MIIGVTGSYGAGKDSFAEILVEKNFFHVSFSDILREELQKHGKKISRDNLIRIGNEMRERFGADILARKALEKVKDGENYVFTSIRNPAELELLQEKKNFVLVNITAPDKVRLQRIVERARENDPKTMKDLLEKESLENSKDKNKQQLQTVTKMAKVIINNDGTKEDLQVKADKFIQDWIYKLQEERPGWDDYFMNIAEQIKMRATCMSAKKGAILVKNKMIISTGYNGSPKKIKHCTAGGCQRCTSRHLGKIRSGEFTEPCICCHAEENAIVQAAFNGVSTEGSVMYTTFTPCTNCAKLIINAGILEVIAKTIYPDDVGTALFKEAGVKLRVIGELK